MRNLRNRLWIGIGLAVAVLLLVALAVYIPRRGDTPEPKKETPVVSPAEIADQIIEKEKKQAEAKGTPSPPSATQAQSKPPSFSDKVFYLDTDINFEQANFLKEVKVSGIYGGEWSFWMQSIVLFQKGAYKDREVEDSIRLWVFLKPASERDDNNYSEFNFALHPPSPQEERWSATVEFFTSRAQGSAQFPFAYDIFIQDWQKEEIAHLARQILDTALTKGKK